MRSDLNQLLRERCVGTVIVPMHESQHADFRWISRGAKVTRGYAIQPRGREPLLLHYPMERDEARASGLATRSIHEFRYNDFFRAEPNLAAAYAGFYDSVLRELEAEGPLAFCGNLPMPLYFEILERLDEKKWTIHRSHGEDLLQSARKRKDADEIARIASVGERTEAVVESVRSLLRRLVISGQRALLEGQPLRLSTLKALVSSEIARLGMIEDHETILSHGRDAGIPHSRGNPNDELRPGVPLVIDIFPSDRDSGYFFDLTRTFCVGEVPERLAAIHADVLAAFELAEKKMKAGTLASDYQNLVCDFFEARKYPTVRRDPATLTGYVHSLGHGVGLEVHERPSFSTNAANSDRIEPGDVVTIEPGLYFPDEAIGVRIEETFYLDESGALRRFCSSDRSLRP